MMWSTRSGWSRNAIRSVPAQQSSVSANSTRLPLSSVIVNVPPSRSAETIRWPTTCSRSAATFPGMVSSSGPRFSSGYLSVVISISLVRSGCEVGAKFGGGPAAGEVTAGPRSGRVGGRLTQADRPGVTAERVELLVVPGAGPDEELHVQAIALADHEGRERGGLVAARDLVGHVGVVDRGEEFDEQLVLAAQRRGHALACLMCWSSTVCASAAVSKPLKLTPHAQSRPWSPGLGPTEPPVS